MRFKFVRILTVLVISAPLAIFAATPPSGTLSPSTPTLTYTYGPNAVSNPTASAQPGGICNPPSQPCDHFDLTVDLPADFAVANPNATIRISTSWAGVDDYDIYLLSATGSIEDDAATSANPEVMEGPAGAGMRSHRIRILPFAVSGSTATTRITLVMPPPPPPDADGDGVTDANDLCPDTPPGSAVGSDGCVITGPPSPQCDLPGPEVLTDADNDHAGGTQAFDIRSLSIAEQNFSDGKKLYFTLKVDSLAQFPTSSARWIVPFTGADGKFYFLRMTKFADSGAPTFEYGTTAAVSITSTTGPGCFSPGTGQVRAALDPASNFKPDGTITLVVAAANLGGLQDGQTLSGITARAQTLDGTSNLCAAGANNDTASAPAPYTVANSCPLIQPPPQLLPSGPPPRFYDFQSPPALADGAGEPTLGYNPKTKNSMFIAGVEVDRVTYAENSDLRDAAGNPLPESCDPVWQNKSYDGAVNTLDPILETEQTTGRTFQSSLSGANSIFAFSDDDGETWIPGQAGPPNGGVDHQTVGVGPWAPGAKPPSATVNYAVYYCSQSVAAAFCARSDNGGVTFGPGIVFRDTATDCNNTLGGLHGHVQVSKKDGTVYVPFGNCGNKVAAAVSTDSGINWTVKTIPQSSRGDDPGLGIASDGTAYMCYSEGDGGKIYASVSKDKGSTWSGHYDLGAAVGVKHAVFATAVAGDGDRAACAFLGTTHPGANVEALDYPGIWHPYVATTYDGGGTWHTVNVAPNDPVQGAGGICLSGTACGSNRNLLDFNDIIMDDQGRALFGYSDGCMGACLQNPASNTFSDNGVIARQSGGRTLLSAFDNRAGTQFNASGPIAPAAACARQDKSTRTNVETRVAWTAPDTGGSPVLNYKVYRATAAAGPYSLIGDSGPKTSFLDPTADNMVEKYYYKVVAENAQGAAPDSNVIELPLTVVVNEDSCTLPGVTAVTDATGDSTGGVAATDIQRVSFAELPGSADKLTITFKVGSLTPVPPNTYWFILTKKKEGQNLFLSMDSEGGIVSFRYGTYTAGTAGLLTFNYQGTLPGSSFEANGNIRLIALRSLFGAIQPGDVISPLDIRTRQGEETVPSRDTASGDYVVRGVKICAPNTPPVAVLTAVPQSGGAPLTVTFDGRESYDVDTGVPDTIKTYVITFGDGSGASATDGATPVWQHTYANPGVYSAKLRVTDSRGLAGGNAAEKVIDVLGANLPPGANAGADFSIDEGQSTLLDGSGSTDPNSGDTLSYEWTQAAGPPVALVNADTATASFTAPTVSADTPLTFRLTVRDQAGASSVDSAIVTVLNVADPVVPPPPPAGNNRLGGGLPTGSLLVVSLLGLLRLASRRRS